MDQLRNFKWIKKYSEQNENKTCQNLWDSVKAVLRGKFIAFDEYIRKEDLSFHLRELEK